MSTYKFKQDFTYIFNKTLMGDRLLVGLKKENSFILIKPEYVESFLKLYESIKFKNNTNFLEKKEIDLINIFIKKGYFEGYETKSSFNEVKFLGKELLSYNINCKNIKLSSFIKNLFYSSYLLIYREINLLIC